jgi:hypothetical protein
MLEGCELFKMGDICTSDGKFMDSITILIQLSFDKN